MASSSKSFQGISPQPSLPSSTLTRNATYDVFINHRGCDVKHKLASTIYYTLKRLGVRAFLDQEELELGDSIPIALQQAIQGASVHIAILSKNYAQSPWCLAELSFMLKTGAPIIPVFYYVEPGDFRWVAQGKGIYASAFSQHVEKGRYSSEILEEWKTALENVSSISGHMLNTDNEDEGRVLAKIVNSVLEAVKIVPLEVAKYPVAMDEIVQQFEASTLQCRESEQHVQIVGIAGFGGAGKTTLAMELYNRKRSSIKRSSFLTDVRLAATTNALPDKQTKLLKDLCGQNESFDNIHEGKAILSNRLRSLSVSILVVLDDVDHPDQVDALLPPKDSLAPGSLIIVTTREGDVLTKSDITSVYKMRPLHQSHAEKLFCFHAFLRPSPLEGFEDLVGKFLNICDGLPLSLKVIGAQLYRNSKDYWESQLSKIQTILPKDILDRLKVSYEALDEEEKEMFLDVACFFIGEKKNLAIAVWDGSDWSGLCGWEKLFSKCLVGLDEEDCITMHDHFRDLGREIAMTHSPSRLFSPLRHSIRIQEGMLLRGIKAGTGWWTRDSYSEQALKECTEMMRKSSPITGLQLLVVAENDVVTQECAEVCRDLVWLRWSGFPHRNLPSWLSLEKLTVLELYRARQLEELWEDEANRLPLQLRELVIEKYKAILQPAASFAAETAGNRLRRLPKSIGRLKHLKKICLNYSALEHLPEEFCLLQSLEHLDLRECQCLQSLPTHFGDLMNLRHLNLSFCWKLRMLPASFKHLKLLEYLNLHACSKLALNLDILENMTKLKVLNFSGCRELQELPHHITNQASLKVLNLEDTSSWRELPANIGQLIKLETLQIGSPLLTSLPTSLGNLSCLTELEIHECKKLESLPESMGRLHLLEHLSIKFSGAKAFPIEFGQLTVLHNLREVVLSDVAVSRISLHGDSCRSLEKLNVDECGHLTEIETLPTTLKEIQLFDCGMLKNIRGIHFPVNLQKIRIVNCPELDEMPSLAGLVCLKHFEIKSSPKLQKLEGLQHVKSLETLKTHTRWNEAGIESLEQMAKLRRVEVVAENRLALHPCLQIPIEKWPSEMILCGRAAHDACSTLDSLTFPGLSLINLLSENSQHKQYRHRLNCPKTHMPNATIICFIIHFDNTSELIIKAGKLYFSAELESGTWVVIGVCLRHKDGIPSIWGPEDEISSFYGPIEVYKAILMVGVEDRVIQVLNQLFQI